MGRGRLAGRNEDAKSKKTCAASRSETKLPQIEAIQQTIWRLSQNRHTFQALACACFCLIEFQRECSLLRLDSVILEHKCDVLRDQVRVDAGLMTNGIDALGLIAGNRTLPLVFARQARKEGIKRLVAVAFEGETDPALGTLVDELVWLKVGQLSKLIAAFTSRGIKQCVMAGQIAPKNLYDIRPDLRAIGVLLRLKEKNAHSIFGAIAQELEKDGVELVEAIPWLRSMMPGPKFNLGPGLSPEQREDVEFGLRIAKAISQLEIGQSVVVKRGTVLAVEGFEGTDKCLARGGELAGRDGGAVAVKVARQNHDFRFDIPCVGPQTLEVCAGARIAVLAIETGKALLLEQDACEELANKNKISVTTVG